MDEQNGEISGMVGLGLFLDRDVYQWYGPLTNITTKNIFVTFKTTNLNY